MPIDPNQSMPGVAYIFCSWIPPVLFLHAQITLQNKYEAENIRYEQHTTDTYECEQSEFFHNVLTIVPASKQCPMSIQ
jgi:hypothetical protein